MPVECRDDKRKMLESLLQGLEGDVAIQAEVATVLSEGQEFFQFLKVTSSSMASFQPLSLLLPEVVRCLDGINVCVQHRRDPGSAHTRADVRGVVSSKGRKGGDCVVLASGPSEREGH